MQFEYFTKILLEAPVITTVAAISAMGLVTLFARILFKIRYVMIKRLFDIILSFIVRIINIPPMLILGIVIKLTSPGPIFYIQTRIGKDGKLFKIIKFRTMHVNAEGNTGPVWAKPVDHRVTKLGRYMRKLYIDEIPQFINILKGDMSFIGPRPERPFFVDTFKKQIQDYTCRLLVKPGLTGLAQVQHKYDESMDDVQKKLKYDIFYIKKMCLILDFKILLWTVGKVILATKSLFIQKGEILCEQ